MIVVEGGGKTWCSCGYSSQKRLLLRLLVQYLYSGISVSKLDPPITFLKIMYHCKLTCLMRRILSVILDCEKFIDQIEGFIAQIRDLSLKHVSYTS